MRPSPLGLALLLCTAPALSEEEVSVRGQKAASVDPAAPRRRVDGALIEQSSRGSLLEAVSQETPGLLVTSRGPFAGVSPGAAGAMRLRGLGASPNTEIVVFEDGIPDMMGLFGHPIPDAYLPAYVASVDVVPGGDSVLFGNGAMGGVIQLRTRWPPGKDDLRVLGELGSFRTLVLQPGALGQVGPVQYLATVRAVHSDGHRDYAGGDELGTLAKARWNPTESLTVTVRQRTLVAHTFDPGTASRPFAEHTVDFDRYNQALSVDHRSGPWSGKTTLYANLGVHRLYDGFQSHDRLLGFWGEETVRVTPTLGVAVGLDARSMGGSGRNLVTGENYGEHSVALLDPYGQAVFRPWPWFALVAGARLHVGSGSTLLLGKLGVEATPWKGLRLAARMVDNYRDPTVVELYLPFPVANPALRSERSRTLECSAGWRSTGLDFEVTAYRSEAWDYIRTLGAFPSFVRTNLDRVAMVGIEGLLRVRLAGPLSARATGSITNVGPYTAQTPSRTLTASLVFDQNPWRVELSGFYAGGLYQRDYAQDPLEDPWQLDARVGRLLGEGARAWVTVRNLTNHRYAFLLDYPMPGTGLFAGLEMAR